MSRYKYTHQNNIGTTSFIGGLSTTKGLKNHPFEDSINKNLMNNSDFFIKESNEDYSQENK